MAPEPHRTLILSLSLGMSDGTVCPKKGIERQEGSLRDLMLGDVVSRGGHLRGEATRMAA